EQRAEELRFGMIDKFCCIIPKARAPPIELHCCHPDPSRTEQERQRYTVTHHLVSPLTDIFRAPWVRTQVYFPDKRLLQWDCGKLQKLDRLLRELRPAGHRVLLFTQMTRMLDILEAFLNIYDYPYLRLDGSTKPDERQRLMERFNNDKRIFC